jgi:hypothetical protein
VTATRLRAASTAEAAGWIGPRLSSDFGTVGATIPDGFEAYTRVFHPADPGSMLTRWSEVAAANGRVMHARAHFSGINSPLDGTALDVPYDAPQIGDLDARDLRSLLSILASAGSAVSECRFGMWEGWGANWQTFAQPFDDPSEFVSMSAATVTLPGRNYRLFLGPLDAALECGFWHSTTWFIPQSPSLIWPADESWCVATEIDFDSTLVGGPTDLIARIVADASLEAWPIELTDSLAYDGDDVNRY